jgi:transcriptional regulator with XRE-family HTH domain
VTAAPAARLQAFAAFVRRATEQAKDARGWSIEDIALRAGISANTVYLWRSGKGTAFPQGQSVEGFCDALGIKPEVAFAILWPGATAKPVAPIPLTPDDDLMVLARRLADPNTPESERFLIRETIRGLAARSARSAGESENAGKRRGTA